MSRRTILIIAGVGGFIIGYTLNSTPVTALIISGIWGMIWGVYSGLGGAK